MSIETSSMLRAGLAAVVQACRVTRGVQRRLDLVREITKDDRSPVTVADFAAQAVVARSLVESLGQRDFRMVGEESTGALRRPDQAAVRAAVLDAVRTVDSSVTETSVLDAIDLGGHDATGDSYWTLDPVDGTKGFLRNGQYALALAFIEAGVVRLGIMGCPNLSADLARDVNDPDPVGTVFFAGAGGGAWVVPANDAASQPRPVRAAAAAPNARIRVCESVETGHTKQDDSARIIEHLGGAGAPARLDSQAKYAVVARGQADAYLRLPTRPGYVEKIWDHAAGMIVATEAGAIVTDIDGRPLDFSHGAGLRENRGVVCASRTFHPRIIDAIRTLGVGAPAAHA